MDPLPAAIYSAADVRAMDRDAIEAEGIPGYELMQRAGRAALDVVRRHWPDARRLAVLCGAGNNGGDGYVLARLAREAGLEVAVAALADPTRLSGDARRAHADFSAAGGRTERFDAAMLGRADLVVDALLGTGADRPVAGAIGECIAAVNGAGRPVLALDLPSGLDADSGQRHGAAVVATRTITFVALKAGLFLGEARGHVGALGLADLSIPARVREARKPVLRRITGATVAEALPPRRPGAHKGDHGRIVVAGGLTMAGAARLAGEAALRAGAGLVAVAADEAAAAAIIAGRPELIVHSMRRRGAVASALTSADAIALGPGLGLDARAQRLFRQALDAGRPMVIDADALTLLARRPRRRSGWILTPHPGEAARLLGSSTAAVQRDRPRAAREIAKRYGGVCVLKGAGTIVQAPGETPWICDAGGPELATAGTGDVLTGVTAALLAGGAKPAVAAAAAVLLHAHAGERAARAGVRGSIAGDLVVELRALVNAPWS